MNRSMNTTVTCIICNGAVSYKVGDSQRFVNHLQNEHGAFVNIDFLIAASLARQDKLEDFVEEIVLDNTLEEPRISHKSDNSVVSNMKSNAVVNNNNFKGKESSKNKVIKNIKKDDVIQKEITNKFDKCSYCVLRNIDCINAANVFI
eukprot:TRINITY_DN80448_c0_g1_i1.p1 TRINITY_DN80448_c0_g1~~TRINITY_DN80448_c0_g1_i1.p1  ORF type:complete len:147 (+),score=19.26 TRINITY_DN80448_c0_g1_i1:2-442(+)